MGGINLSRRPFVNRRPVQRLAGLLWLIGVVLLLVNVRLYSRHLQGSDNFRQQLSDLNVEVREAREKLREKDAGLAEVNLSRQNGQAKFLNSLIDYRRFPWSALFDDLEEVLPDEVRLVSVTPAIRLVAAEPEPRRRRRTSRRNASQTTATPAPVGEKPGDLRSNEVSLQLIGVAKSEDALMEFIDTLYNSRSFRNPFLPGEDFQGGSVQFSIDVLYRTRSGPKADEDPDLSEDLIDPVEDPSSDPDEGDVATLPGEATGSGDESLESGDVVAQPGIAASSPEKEPAVAAQSRRPRSGPNDSIEADEASRPARAGEAPAQRSPRGRRGSGTQRGEGRSRVPRLIGNAVPVESGGAGSGTEAPGPTQPAPPTGPVPGFADPPASATPTLRRGSLSGQPPITLPTTRGTLA